jgi:hypothetical protein
MGIRVIFAFFEGELSHYGRLSSMTDRANKLPAGGACGHACVPDQSFSR